MQFVDIGYFNSKKLAVPNDIVFDKLGNIYLGQADNKYYLLASVNPGGSYISSVANTAQIVLAVSAGGVLTALFVSNQVSQFINDSLYLQTVTADGVTITGTGVPGDPLVAVGGGGGTVWYTGAGAPVGLHNDGDFYLNSTNGDYYEQVSGAWVLQGSLLGATGATGATGANGVVPIVTATGTVDVITATYSPVLTLSNLVMCAIVTSGTNTTAVTFSPDGLTVHAIVYDGVALVAGQMPKVAMLEYDLPNTRWELLNPIATVSLTNVKKGSFGATWDGQGAVIGTGAWQEIIVPYAGTITDWVIDSYTPATGVVVSGSIIIELYRSGASIIGAGNKPTLASASTNSAAVAGWTSTAVAAGDKLYAYVSSSPVSCLKVTCTFNITKT